MTRSLAIAGAAFLACAAVGTRLHAQGLEVDEQSDCTTGRAGAAVAEPCNDASGVYFSPGGLALQGTTFSIGGSIIRTSNTFTYDPAAQPLGAPSSVKRGPANVFVPHAFLSVKATDRLALAIGAFAPYGARLSWPVCAAPTATAACTTTNFEGRFTGYDNTLRAIYVQPTVAYQIVPGKISIGAGLDMVRTNIDVFQRVAGTPVGLRNSDIADVELSGSGTGWTGHVGIDARPTSRTSLGIRYLHSAKVKLNGDATATQIPTGTLFDPIIASEFTGNGPLANQGISTTVRMPSQLAAGVAYRPIDPLTLMFDYQWTTWNKFDQFDIAFAGGSSQVFALNYRNTNTFRLGAQYDFASGLALRAGARYNNAASPRATPFLPEGERNYFALGAGLPIMHVLQADASFQLVDQPDRRGAVRPDEPTVGSYSTSGTIFGLTLAYHFGGNTAPR